MIAVVAALMTGVAHAQTTKLIDPGTGAGDDIKNGGFESGNTGTYPNYTVVTDWFNSGGGTSVVAAGNDRERTGAYGGSVALTGVGASHPAVDTGHTIAAGDLLNLTFYHGRAEDWDAADTIGVVLYSTAGVIWSDTVTPSQNALTGNFDLFTANHIPVPLANIGETLFLRFESNASLNEYAAVDDITLTVSPIPEPASFALAITPAIAPATGFDLAWQSQAGKLYNLRTSTDLANPIAGWDLVAGDIVATPPTNVANVDPADPRRFYAVEKFDAPPPPPTEPVYISDWPSDRLSATQDWGGLGVDTAVKPPGNAAPLKLSIGGREYAHGLGAHANGHIMLRLDGKYETFEAEIGVQTQLNNIGSVVFCVLGDGAELFRSEVMRGGQQAKKIQVSVAGIRYLFLALEDAGDGITGDAGNWAEARLVLAATPWLRPLTPPAHNLASTALAFVSAPDPDHGEPLQMEADGSYRLDPGPDGKARIGLQWEEGLCPGQWVGLRLAGGTVLGEDTIRLRVQHEDWTWHELPDEPLTDGDLFLWLLSPGDANRTVKAIEWVMTAMEAVVVKNLYISGGPGSWQTATLRLEASDAEHPLVTIESSQGVLLDGQGGELPRCAWDTSVPLEIDVRYRAPKPVKDERTLLHFTHPAGGFSVAVEDVAAQGSVFIRHAGVLVTAGGEAVAVNDHSVLKQVREMPDQTLEQAMSKTHNPLQDRGPTMLSLACDNRKFTLDARGIIQGRLTPQFGVGGAAVEGNRHLDGGWLPIPSSDFTQGDGPVYRQRTCVAPMDDAPPALTASWVRQRAVCVVEWTVENRGSTDAETRLAVSFAVPQGRTASFLQVEGGIALAFGDELAAYFETADAGGLTLNFDGASLTLSGRLAAGGFARCYACLPAQTMAVTDCGTLSGGARWFERTTDYWAKVMAPAMQIDVPDALLANVIRASQVHCMLAARDEDDGRRVAAWIATHHYGALDSESQAVIRGMDMVGQQEFARRALDYWLHRYTPDGPMAKNYSIVGTGQNLWTLAEHYQRTDDRAWLEQAAPRLVAACRWIGRERSKSMVNDNIGRPVPEWGLMPPNTSADWTAVAYRFYNDALFHAGLSAASAALDDIQRPEAAELLTDASAYRQDIRRAYHWTQERSPVLPLPGGAWVRAYPALHGYFGLPEEYFPGVDVGRTWCYAVELGAHHLAVNGVLDPAAADVTEMLDHMEDVQFLRDGWHDYPADRNRQDVFNLGGFGKVQPYYARNVELYALRDDVKPFIRSYFNSLASLLDRGRLSLWEHFANTYAWNKTHETGWFLCQSRILFVQERGDELWLAPFVACNWLKDGLTVAVKQAPTRFGPVGYRIDSSADSDFIEATIEPPVRTSPGAIVIRLRHPDGKPIRSVTVNGEPHSDFSPAGEYVRLNPSADPIMVRADY
jgi:hypothetical protein